MPPISLNAAEEPSSTSDPNLLISATKGRCAIAAKTLPAGSAVARFSGKPYASCPLPSQRERLCAACLKPAQENQRHLRCGRCKWVRYCGQSCQRGDWALHKHECPALAENSDSPLRRLADGPAADVLLAGRCLWRRHGVTDPSPEDKAFDAMERATPTQDEKRLGQLAADTPGLLPPLDDGNIDAFFSPSDIVAKLIASFARNNFGCLNDLLSVVGAGCYPDAALLNHSCAPNCVLAFDGAHLEIRTIKPVEKSEELTHSYVDLCQPTVTRRRVLKGRYGFDCVCERCEGGGGVPMSTEDLINTNPVHDLDALLTCEVADCQLSPGSELLLDSTEQLTQSCQLLDAAGQETSDLDKELALLGQALTIRRQLCHPLSAMRYEAECRALTASLAAGRLVDARECCKAAVRFLEVALAHVPCHPLLALQLFTLADLENACAQTEGASLSEAVKVMDECERMICVSYARNSPMRATAKASAKELMSRFMEEDPMDAS